MEHALLGKWSCNYGWYILGGWCERRPHQSGRDTGAGHIPRFPWRKFPVYVIVQLLGSLTAGGLLYAVYHDAVHHYGPGLTSTTGQSFYTIPQPYLSPTNAFWNEYMATAVLTCFIFALCDDQNSPPGAGMNSLIIGLVVTLLGLTSVTIRGPCRNPMRGLATRLVAVGVGYPTQATFKNWWCMGGVWGACIAGSITDAAVYDLFIFVGWRESGELYMVIKAGGDQQAQSDYGT
ncbi:aquaporin-like protein [Zopfia rhizophila CBS 207.26]|uniref:Aquaporin-like protein n=1 Tax=Zopfia rhizophila CBS 207.26 TaxID=1314779 RepID=A0A6A6ECM4_9PEZI|nr:aquaporin-like protein [Zopfia rhizophila CBS 207.26]